jgi:nucleoside 2-deoxyribosyltransferase
MKIYLASPFGFAESARIIRWQQIDAAVGRANQEMIDPAETIVAVLDGVDVESGTASEIGDGFPKGKVIYGLRTDFLETGENDGGLVNLQVRYVIDASGESVATTVDDLLAVMFGSR